MNLRQIVLILLLGASLTVCMSAEQQTKEWMSREQFRTDGWFYFTNRFERAEAEAGFDLIKPDLTAAANIFERSLHIVVSGATKQEQQRNKEIYSTFGHDVQIQIAPQNMPDKVFSIKINSKVETYPAQIVHGNEAEYVHYESHGIVMPYREGLFAGDRFTYFQFYCKGRHMFVNIVNLPLETGKKLVDTLPLNEC